MPIIEIAKLKTRRGLNSQRKLIIFDQGEIVSTTDTNRAFLGTGTLSGGKVIGSKIHNPIINLYSLSSIDAEIGDLIYVNNIYYQLTASPPSNIDNWINTGTKLDPVLFNYDDDNNLTITPQSISSIYLNPDSISNGIKVSDGVLQSNFNTKSLEISAFQLSIKSDGIDEREINSSTISYGLTGGSGVKIQLDVDPEYFFFDGNTLSLSSVPTTLSDVDGDSIVKDIDGVISINNDGASGTHEWSQLTVDQFGRVTTEESSILDVITGNSTLSSYNSNNSLSAIYNGDSLGLSGLNITQFTGLSSDGTTIINLSSAGFITFEGGNNTRNGTSVGRFAIPIYRY